MDCVPPLEEEHFQLVVLDRIIPHSLSTMACKRKIRFMPWLDPLLHLCGRILECSMNIRSRWVASCALLGLVTPVSQSSSPCRTSCYDTFCTNWGRVCRNGWELLLSGTFTTSAALSSLHRFPFRNNHEPQTASSSHYEVPIPTAVLTSPQTKHLHTPHPLRTCLFVNRSTFFPFI